MRRLIAAVCVIAGSTSMVAAPAEAGGGGCHEGRTTGTGSEVHITNMCFSPTVLQVADGTAVTFVNGDEMLHAISGTGLGYDELSGGGRTTLTFRGAGVHPYMCHIHPSMTGAVIVGDESPVLAGATRPAPAEAGGDVSPALVAAIAAALGLGAGAFLQRKRVART